MKVLKETKTKTIITGVELSGKELLELLKAAGCELEIELPMEVPDPIFDSKIWTSNPTWDKWEINGSTIIKFDSDDELPIYLSPSPVKKKVVKKK